LNRAASSCNTDDELVALDSLKNNQFFSKMTFEQFLERKKKGKRTLFYSKPDFEKRKEMMLEYQH
jgi:hypothetical protein